MLLLHVIYGLKIISSGYVPLDWKALLKYRSVHCSPIVAVVGEKFKSLFIVSISNCHNAFQGRILCVKIPNVHEML